MQQKLLDRDIGLPFAFGRQVDLSRGRLHNRLCELDGEEGRVEALAASGCAIADCMLVWL
jgi:hypothetical protein